MKVNIKKRKRWKQEKSCKKQEIKVCSVCSKKLTPPLHFNRKYHPKCVKIVLARYSKEYRQRPVVKAKKKARNKEDWQRPEVKAKAKEYLQRPVVKARRKEYGKEYYQKKKLS